MESSTKEEEVKSLEKGFSIEDHEQFKWAVELAVNLKSEIPEDFACNICKKLVYEPLTCNMCDELFCKLCIEKSKLKTCPCCK